MRSRRRFAMGGILSLGIIGLLVAGIALAHEGHSQERGGLSTVPGTAQAGKEQGGQAQVQIIQGEVVDLACYLSQGLMGPGHRECAQQCISSGLPVGIKSGDTVYLAMGSEHGPANATLAPLAAKQVKAEGIVTERDGVRLIAIKKVTVQE